MIYIDFKPTTPKQLVQSFGYMVLASRVITYNRICWRFK